MSGTQPTENAIRPVQPRPNATRRTNDHGLLELKVPLPDSQIDQDSIVNKLMLATTAAKEDGCDIVLLAVNANPALERVRQLLDREQGAGVFISVEKPKQGGGKIRLCGLFPSREQPNDAELLNYYHFLSQRQVR